MKAPKVDGHKLGLVIQHLCAETVGLCTRSTVCIGKVGEFQVQVTVEADPEEFMDLHGKWLCVREANK